MTKKGPQFSRELTADTWTVMSKKGRQFFFRVTPSVAAPSDTDPSDATAMSNSETETN